MPVVRWEADLIRLEGAVSQLAKSRCVWRSCNTPAMDELQSSAHALRSLLLLARAALCPDVGGVAALRDQQR